MLARGRLSLAPEAMNTISSSHAPLEEVQRRGGGGPNSQDWLAEGVDCICTEVLLESLASGLMKRDRALQGWYIVT